MMENQQFPLQIGVTGGIGSGKSVVCRIFSCLGVPVYNADERAKWLTTYDPAVKGRVVELLGTEAYLPNGAYNRSYVSSRVFQNGALLNALNDIVHPAVQLDTVQWVSRHKGFAYVVKEAAIMKRAGDGNDLDFIIVVEAPEDVRIKRVLRRDQRTEKEIKAIIARQVSDEDRREAGDFIIVNDDFTALIPQVVDIHNRLLRQSKP